MMKINPLKEPFNHIIVEDYLSEQEYELIWKELMFLYPRMRPPEGTSAASDYRGVRQKKGIGIFVDNVFTDREMSDILRISRKVLCNEIVAVADNDLDLYYKLLRSVDHDSTLAQLYTNGDYYRAHRDTSVFTTITILHKTPKQYTGGELYFPEFDYKVELSNNQALIFPSILLHEVCEVKQSTVNPEDGRFSISQLMNVFHARQQNRE